MANIYELKRVDFGVVMIFDVQSVGINMDNAVRLRNMLTDYINSEQGPVSEFLRGNSNSSKNVEKP